MTQRYDAGHTPEHVQAYAPDFAQDILDRWCKIAEQRLGYLVELYESGRWRRYHSERAFMENVREARAAVETWRGLARRTVTPHGQAIDRPRGDQPVRAAPVTQDETGQSPARLLGTAAVHAALASIVSLPEDALVEANDDAPVRKQIASASDTEPATAIAPDPRILHERYPVLRYNAL